MGVILKTLRGVGIQVARVMVRGISTLTDMLLLDSGKFWLPEGRDDEF
jgi:hypothetical protein